MAKILIVEDHPIVVEGLRKMLFDSGKCEICGIALSAKECLEHLKCFSPEVILMDINLPDINGIDLCKQIKEAYPQIKIIGISSFREKSYVKKIIENGASGYILKNAMPEEIIYGINQVLQGKRFFDEETEALLNDKNREESIVLTRREKEVLNLIADGLTNPEIAEKLFVSTSTIDSHRKNMILKLNVKNTAALIKKSIALNLIHFD